MSRDFSPDLDSFREVARETREKPPESSRTARGRASRQKEEDRDSSVCSHGLERASGS